MYSYILLETAQHEYETSLIWYAERSEQAAENYVFAIDNAIDLIVRFPTRWRNKFKNFYELGVKKYPYSIIYTIDAEKEIVVIYAVFHHKRNPKKKYKKVN